MEENRDEIKAHGKLTYFRTNNNHVNVGLFLMPFLRRKKKKKDLLNGFKSQLKT